MLADPAKVLLHERDDGAEKPSRENSKDGRPAPRHPIGPGGKLRWTDDRENAGLALLIHFLPLVRGEDRLINAATRVHDVHEAVILERQRDRADVLVRLAEFL